jgi:plastocyanin
MKFKILSMFVLMIMLTLVLVSCGKIDNISEDDVESDLTQIETLETKADGPSTNTVIIESGRFKPTDVEVRIGGTIEWNNAGNETYTVTLENGDFSKEMPPGASVTHTFEEEGIYPYFSLFQPEMRGSVIVK